MDSLASSLMASLSASPSRWRPVLSKYSNGYLSFDRFSMRHIFT